MVGLLKSALYAVSALNEILLFRLQQRSVIPSEAELPPFVAILRSRGTLCLLKDLVTNTIKPKRARHSRPALPFKRFWIN